MIWPRLVTAISCSKGCHARPDCPAEGGEERRQSRGETERVLSVISTADGGVQTAMEQSRCRSAISGNGVSDGLQIDSSKQAGSRPCPLSVSLHQPHPRRRPGSSSWCWWLHGLTRPYRYRAATGREEHDQRASSFTAAGVGCVGGEGGQTCFQRRAFAWAALWAGCLIEP